MFYITRKDAVNPTVMKNMFVTRVFYLHTQPIWPIIFKLPFKSMCLQNTIMNYDISGGVTSTPTFMINDVIVGGDERSSQTADEWIKYIQQLV